jgi:hypothetical protein
MENKKDVTEKVYYKTGDTLQKCKNISAGYAS